MRKCDVKVGEIYEVSSFHCGHNGFLISKKILDSWNMKKSLKSRQIRKKKEKMKEMTFLTLF